MEKTLKELLQLPQDEKWEWFLKYTNSKPYLKNHRDWVEKNQWGYGERQFHGLWDLLVDELDCVSFLEIGVFRGQTLSLIPFICKQKEKLCTELLGITPLSSSGDKYSTHPKHNYSEDIDTIFAKCGFGPPTLIRGYSTSDNVKLMSQSLAGYVGFDIVYIDGCHDYQVVAEDIENYSRLVSENGYLVIDDACYYENLPKNQWPGLEDVSNAVRNTIDEWDNFEYLGNVGHIKLFQRIG